MLIVIYFILNVAFSSEFYFSKVEKSRQEIAQVRSKKLMSNIEKINLSTKLLLSKECEHGCQKVEKLLLEIRDASPEYLRAKILLIGYYLNNAKDQKKAAFEVSLIHDQLIEEAESGSLEVINILAIIYYNGIGVTQNYELSFGLYEILVKYNYSLESKYRLSEMYYQGKGIDVNIKKAKCLLEELAELNYKNSKEILSRIQK